MNTSESWIASIILVLNLVKLAGEAFPCLLVRIIKSFSASVSQFVYAGLETVEWKYANESFKISKSQQDNFKMVA